MNKMDKEKILSYTNQRVIDRYIQEYNRDSQFANDCFKNMLIWLYVANRCNKQGVVAGMYDFIYELDNMWHTFLMFTRDYTNYCNENYGEFLHHEPMGLNTESSTVEEKKLRLKNHLLILQAEFGDDVVRLWCEEKKFAK
jgi:hypothetical protein